MLMTRSVTKIQDKDSSKRLSVVRSVEDPTKFWVVLLNPDWSRIWWWSWGGWVWWSITGTLSNQTDLQAELDLKANANADNQFIVISSILVTILATFFSSSSCIDTELSVVHIFIIITI